MTARRTSPARLAMLVLLFAGVVAFKGLAEFRGRYLFTVNHTESLPHWAFLVDRRGAPKRGDYVYFIPPDNPYYRNTGFVKIVAGVGGDIVRRDGRNFYINDRFIGASKPYSRAGYPLAPGPVGIIPHDQYFVFTPHKDSYDSRYEDIGWIGRASLIGVARPVL